MKGNSRMKVALVLALAAGAILGILLTMLVAKKSINQKEQAFASEKTELMTDSETVILAPDLSLTSLTERTDEGLVAAGTV